MNQLSSGRRGLRIVLLASLLCLAFAANVAEAADGCMSCAASNASAKLPEASGVIVLGGASMIAGSGMLVIDSVTAAGEGSVVVLKGASDGVSASVRVSAELGRQLLASRTGMIKLNYDRREEWLAAMDWGNHHLGTTRMSADPKTGVVDPQGQVFGVPNLYVAGSSVFPTYGSSNPTMNLLALTLRLGDRLKKVMA